MRHQDILKISFIMLLVVLAACAPATLDITPSPTPTDIPTSTPVPTTTPTPAVTATPQPTASAGDASVNVSNDEFVDLIVAGMPNTVPGGAVQWIYDQSRAPERVRNVQNGTARKIFLTERTGGQGNLTFGVFDSPEAALAHYEFIAGLRASLETGNPRDNFPEPNLFGGGLYGSNAITVVDNIFVEVSVEAFSSTAGDPLPSLMRAALNIVDEGIARAAEGPIQLDPVLQAINDTLTDTLEADGVEWTRGNTVPVLVENGTAIEIQYSSGTSQVSIFFGKFNTPSSALTAYGDLSSRGTTGLQVNEFIVAVRADEARLGLLRVVIEEIEPILE